MKRRDFLKRASKTSVGICLTSPFILCGDKNPSSPEEFPSEDYYFRPEYVISKDVSNSAGNIGAQYNGNLYTLRLENKNHEPISGLESIFYAEEKYKTKAFFVKDPLKRYMPQVHTFSLGKGEFNVLEMASSEDALWQFVNGTFFDEVGTSMPSWDSNKVDDMPGRVYLGDWSFNDLKSLNTNLKTASMILTTVAPNPYSAAAYGFLSSTDLALDSIDYAINIINNFTGTKIDKDKDYSIYTPSIKDNTNLIVSLGKNILRPTEDIRYLIPLEEGNSWTYRIGNSTGKTTINGTKKVNGEKCLVCKNANGIEEYLGFKGNMLNYYGMTVQGIGGIFFEPPVQMGDNEVRVGKKYNTHSKVSSTGNLNISGNVKDVLSFQKKETILASGTPFGDCYKVKEDFEMDLVSDGENIRESSQIHHWLSKNVGKVKIDYGDQVGELISANVNQRVQKSSLNDSSNIFISPLTKKFIDILNI